MRNGCKWHWYVPVVLVLAACGGGGGGGGSGGGGSDDDVVRGTDVVADAGSGSSLLPGAIVTLDASASEPSDGATFRWRQLSGPDVTLSADDGAEVTFMAPSLTDSSDVTLVFEVVVTVGDASDTDRVTYVISLSGENQDPVADAGPDQVVDGGDGVTLDAAGSFDPEGESLEYSWTQTGGYGITLTPDSDIAAPGFTAAVLPADEVLTFELRVSDGVRSSVDTMTVTMKGSADGPYDIMADAGSDQVATDGDTVTLSAAGSSIPDGTSPEYQWSYLGDTSAGPAPDFSGADTDTLTFSAPGTDAQDADRILDIQLTVSVGSSSDTDQVAVEVWPVDNNPPTIFSRSPDVDFVGADFDTTVRVRFSDAGTMDADTITTDSFFLTDQGGTVVSATISANSTHEFVLTPTTLLSSLETYTVHLTDTITDRSGNAFAGETWNFRVRGDGAPTASAGPTPLFVERTEIVTLDGSASSDSEQSADSLTYAWTGPDGIAISNADQAVASFVAPATVAGGEFTLTVTDRSGNSDTENTYVTVLEDTDNAVFVSNTSGDDANTGSWDAPVLTLTRGLELAGQGDSASDVYLRAGQYDASATVSVADGVSLHGGFRTPTAFASSAITGWVVSGDSTSRVDVDATTGLRAQDITLDTVVSRMRVDVNSGDPGVNAPGEDSIAVLVRGGDAGALTLRDNIFNAGRGGAGASITAAPAQAWSGRAGTGGGDGDDFDQKPNGGSGGNGCGVSNGGDGGSGGYGDEGGSAGAAGTLYTGGTLQTAGYGGGVEKNGGHGGSGVTGGRAGGPGGNGGTLDAQGFLVATRGSSGTDGYDGPGGGGGGGGGGGPLSFTNVADTGGGGGGGGGGGCGGSGGTGGYGGGGSYAVYLIAASPTISGNELRTLGGGDGGDGSDGGQGGNGGAGGSGGDDNDDGGAGGDGGAGASGAGGGGGGGGAGGASYAIYRAMLDSVASSPVIGVNDYAPGSGGDGGLGGASGEGGSNGFTSPDTQRGTPGGNGSDGTSASY